MSHEHCKEEGQGDHPCCQVELQMLGLIAAIYNNTYTNKYQWLGLSGNGLKRSANTSTASEASCQKKL